MWKEEKQKRDTVDQRPKRGRKEKDVNLSSLKYEQFIASFFPVALIFRLIPFFQLWMKGIRM